MMSGKINETIDAHEVNNVKYNLFVALSNAEPFSICGLITVGALSNFHRLAQHSLLRRCIRKSYGYVLGYCISSLNFFDLCIRNSNQFFSIALVYMLLMLKCYSHYIHLQVSRTKDSI